jgi:hypothetical protein
MRLVPLSEKFRRMSQIKFAFGKNTRFSEEFAEECNALSMHDTGFGLGIPSDLSAENQLRGVFTRIMQLNGIFLFNISGVNLKTAIRGFTNYEQADYNNQITEWELFILLSNKDYFKSCIFHNGKVQFKKTLLWKSIT